MSDEPAERASAFLQQTPYNNQLNRVNLFAALLIIPGSHLFVISLLPTSFRFPLQSVCPNSRVQVSAHHLQLCSVSVHLIPSFSTKGLLFPLILISFWEYTQPFSCANCSLCEDSVFRSISRELDRGLAVSISEHSWSQVTSFGLFLLSEGKNILPGELKSETESNDSVAKQYQDLL